jgi:Restriction endonuclease
LEEAAQQPAWRRFQAPQNQGRGFEKFIAAIERVEASGAQVTWNERIGGRQFDVTIRKAVGQDTELTVIEARDHSKKPVGAPDVEAFVTKARDAGAHKAVMVAPTRFTGGALRVAEKNGVDLRTLKEFTEYLPELVNVRHKLRYEYAGPDGRVPKNFDEADLRFDTVFTPGRFYRNTPA